MQDDDAPPTKLGRGCLPASAEAALASATRLAKALRLRLVPAGAVLERTTLVAPLLIVIFHDCCVRAGSPSLPQTAGLVSALASMPPRFAAAPPACHPRSDGVWPPRGPSLRALTAFHHGAQAVGITAAKVASGSGQRGRDALPAAEPDGCPSARISTGSAWSVRSSTAAEEDDAPARQAWLQKELLAGKDHLLELRDSLESAESEAEASDAATAFLLPPRRAPARLAGRRAQWWPPLPTLLRCSPSR